MGTRKQQLVGSKLHICTFHSSIFHFYRNRWYTLQALVTNSILSITISKVLGVLPFSFLRYLLLNLVQELLALLVLVPVPFVVLVMMVHSRFIQKILVFVVHSRKD